MVTELTMHDMINAKSEPDDDLRIVMFYGATCGPCKATMPNYELAAEHYSKLTSNIKFYKVNAWHPPEQFEFCKKHFNLNGVPQFKVFCRSKVVFEKAGGGDENTMKKFIQDSIDETFKKFGVRI